MKRFVKVHEFDRRYNGKEVTIELGAQLWVNADRIIKIESIPKDVGDALEGKIAGGDRRYEADGMRAAWWLAKTAMGEYLLSEQEKSLLIR